MLMLRAASAPAGAALALLAALFWGGGDFSGGMGVKAAGGTVRGALRVIVSAHTISLVALMIARFVSDTLTPGPPLRGAPVAWGLFAGMVAGLSLAAFYVALARGAMGSAAAVSGLLAAAIPALVGIAVEGRPGGTRVLGFALAAVAIWWIASPSEASASPLDRGNLALAILGGIGFGVYFTALKFANPLGVLGPLTMARTGSVTTCLLLLLAQPSAKTADTARAGWLNGEGWMWAAGVALLDSGGNLLYTAATRAGRLDVAAVLASLYPASTILLAAAVLKEHPGRRQLAGMAIAAVAVVLVTL